MAEQHWSCGCFAVDGKVVQSCRTVPKGTELAAHQVTGIRAAEAHECFRERQESQAAAVALTEQKTVELPTPDGNTYGPQGSATVTAVDTDTNTVTLEAVDGVQS